MQRDSIANTFIVAVSLCVVCAVLVSSAAVGLRTRQDENKKLDKQKNILLAAGLMEGQETSEEIEKTYDSRVKPLLINLDSGEVVEGEDPTSFDPIKDAKSGEDDLRIVLDVDPAGIKVRENKEVIYKISDSSGNTQQYVFPIRGYGLWSTLYGYIALDNDMETVNGISYYQHAETPGLGGEVDNPSWKAQWKGKKIYDIKESEGVPKRSVELTVKKGNGMTDYEIDGLSGASITGKGVENMIKFWFGDKGYLPFIKNTVPTSGTPTGA